MISETLLKSVRTLSMSDKLLFMQTIAYMLRQELAAYEQSANEQQQNGAKPDRLAQIMQDAQTDASLMVAELLSRPHPTPDKCYHAVYSKGN